MDGRRTLSFSRLDDVMADVEQLLDGHTTVGQWTLGQILSHLAIAVRLSLVRASFPSPATPEQEVMRRKFFEAGRFPESVAIPSPLLVPDPGADASTEAKALRRAIGLLVAHEGPFTSHPRLGSLTKDEWLRLHCIHCAHHLGFALPTPATGRTHESPGSAG